ncbi:MAG: methyl-accepting chemotaxis protein [Lachnospiraceae bacterium]|nr:methyl-accepting chemotaxis protein [Lachnospiraceae bacterium]
MKKLSSIKAKISFVMILFITAAVIIAIIVNYKSLTNMAHDTLTDYISDSLLEIVKAHGAGIDESIEKYNSTMKYLDSSENFFVFHLNNGNKFSKEVHASLKKYMESNPTHESINYVCGDDLLLLASSIESTEGVSYADRGFVKYIMENNLPAQSNIFFDEETGEPMISIGVPQTSNYDDTTLGGVLFTNIKVSLLADELTDISVFDSDTSYACLLDSNGVFIYHPNESLVGTKSDNPTITAVVDQIAAGSAPAAGLVTNESTGQYLAYNVSDLNNWIFCLLMDQDVILDPLVEMRQSAVSTSIATCLIIIAVFTVLGFIFASTITTPIKTVTNVISRTADLDISLDTSYHSLLKHKDETGEMSRALQKMRSSFRRMMTDISSASEYISNSADQLHQIATTVNDNANDNSTTAQQVSASMEHTAQNTESISNEMLEVEQNTSDITAKAREGVSLSEEIMKRAEKLKEDTIQASTRTRDIYQTVKETSTVAIEDSKSVSKINELAKNIQEIASQTSLLSLNASIEAARAGEQGRGFAVVADEIGKLAEQSSQTVSGITQIVTEVNAAVERMADSLNAALDFLDSTVLADYGNFMKVSEQYSDDAGFVNRTMAEIDASIGEMNHTMARITEAINRINGSISETSSGVVSVVDNNANIVSLATDTYNMVQETMTHADTLREIVNSFTLNR